MKVIIIVIDNKKNLMALNLIRCNFKLNFEFKAAYKTRCIHSADSGGRFGRSLQ